MTPRERLVAKIRRIGMPPASMADPQIYPVVSLDEFFEGNADPGSIGCNLPDAQNPGIAGFYEVLRNVRSRPNVQDVLVEIHEVIEDDDSTWPFTDRIYFLTSATRPEVENWLQTLHPSELSVGYMFGVPPGAPPLLQGMSVYGAWFD